jgi:transketolase
MPCWELFEETGPDEQEAVLPDDVPVLAVEAASPFGWDRWADGVVGLDHFGASAPYQKTMEAFGFTARNVADQALALLDALDEGEEE